MIGQLRAAGEAQEAILGPLRAAGEAHEAIVGPLRAIAAAHPSSDTEDAAVLDTTDLVHDFRDRTWRYVRSLREMVDELSGGSATLRRRAGPPITWRESDLELAPAISDARGVVEAAKLAIATVSGLGPTEPKPITAETAEDMIRRLEHVAERLDSLRDALGV